MICPRCNREFSNEFDHCLVCGAQLKEYTPIMAEPMEKAEEQPLLVDENLPQLLATIDGEQETRSTLAYLQEMNVPCMSRPSSDAGWFDVFVPGSMLLEALELLEQQAQQEPEPIQEDCCEQTKEQCQAAPKKWYEFWK